MNKIFNFTLLLVFFFPFAAQAQGGLSFERLTIEIWPEYDEPSALIIYRGFLSPDVSLPARVTFQIPTQAGQPNAVAVRGPDDQLMSVQYDRVVKGEYAEISFTATSTEIQFEYYDPSLQKEGQNRQFSYTWPGHYPVRSATFIVQQPRGAAEMETSPPFGESFQGSDGLTYYRTSETSLAIDETKTIHLEYQKESQALSIGDQPVQPSTPIEPRISFSFQGRKLIPWLLGGLGFLLIVSAVVLYWRFGLKLSSQSTINTEPTRQKPVFPDRGSYCSQCGSKVGENDRFCRVCGQRLK